jgi:hypothetical protein
VAVDSVTGGNPISGLVGSSFRLEADNNLVAVRNSDSNYENTDEIEEDSLLFQGRLANISPIGNGLYEAIAYDPGQQAFNIGGESGSVINQKLDFTGSITNPEFVEPEEQRDNDVSGTVTIGASTLVEQIVNEAGITDYEIDLGPRTPADTDIGDVASQPAGDVVTEYGIEQQVEFNSQVVSVKDALDKVREQTRSEWWFDKRGTFHFGEPDVSAYDITLIKDSSAGITTPPYQSVRVIGSSTATSDGWESTNQVQDDDNIIVKEAIIARPQAAGKQSERVIILDPTEEQFQQFQPPFKYINAELSTDEQVQNAALKIADELAKQQASGTITTVGFPEVVPFDGLAVPNTESQPMGGQLYEVYKVTHRLNASDGFITKIEVAGPSGLR